MFKFKKDGTIRDLQKFTNDVYSLTDDRFYSIWDILTQQQRFVMRALKGIRKGDPVKIRVNLLIAFTWFMAICNRLHLDIEDEIWKRFPYLCSYCGQKPCACKKIKPAQRLKVKINNSVRPGSLDGFQMMFAQIYTPQSRTLADAGVHLAEEMGEVSEAIHNYLGQHHYKQFEEVKLELADFASCIIGVANSVPFNMSKDLAKMFKNNCHVCHKAPCICTFGDVTKFKV